MTHSLNAQDSEQAVRGKGQDIGRLLHYEQERSTAVTLSCDWQTDTHSQSIDLLFQVMKGGSPAHVHLAELAPARRWTRKLKLILPAHPDREVTLVGAGAPRLLESGQVVYLLPIPAAKRTSASYRHFLLDDKLKVERLTYDEVLGGLSDAASRHIQKRMADAALLTDEVDVVPKVIVRGTFSIPGWDGSFMAYETPSHHRPAYFLQPDTRQRMFGGNRGVDLFRAGVRSLFAALRQLNQHDGGLFHGDLVHRSRRGSANLGFTVEGTAVVTGWGRRMDEAVSQWPRNDFRLQQMREVVGALAGLLMEIMDCRLDRDQRHRVMVETVQSGLEEYTDRPGAIDRVALATGLPSDSDRLTRVRRADLSDLDSHERAFQAALTEECGQLEDQVRRWLVKCVDEHL